MKLDTFNVFPLTHDQLIHCVFRDGFLKMFFFLRLDPIASENDTTRLMHLRHLTAYYTITHGEVFNIEASFFATHPDKMTQYMSNRNDNVEFGSEWMERIV